MDNKKRYSQLSYTLKFIKQHPEPAELLAG